MIVGVRWHLDLRVHQDTWFIERLLGSVWYKSCGDICDMNRPLESFVFLFCFPQLAQTNNSSRLLGSYPAGNVNRLPQNTGPYCSRRHVELRMPSSSSTIGCRQW